MGQVLTVSAAIITHARLTGSSEDLQSCIDKLEVIDAAFTRNKQSCRIFDRIAAQLDTFLQICQHSSTSTTLFDKNERLIQHILHYGTSYERLGSQKTGE